MKKKVVARPVVISPADEAVWAEKAAEIRQAYGKSVEKLLDAGRLLTEFQASVVKKSFRLFIETHLKWSRTHVYRLINVHKCFAECSKLEQFDISALYTLSAKNAPAKARKEALKRAEKGEFISNKEALRLVAKHSDAGEKNTMPPYRLSLSNGGVVQVRVPSGDLSAIQAALKEALEQIAAKIEAEK